MNIFKLYDTLIQLFGLSYFKKEYLRPNLEVNSINDINISYLKKMKITSLIFDVDSTLCVYNTTTLDPKLVKTFTRLKSSFRTCLLSNTGKNRRRILEQRLGVFVVNSPRSKPRNEPFQQALKYLHSKPEETAMIGDRYLTDIVGANKMGIFSIKVNSLNTHQEPLPIKVVRYYESVLIRVIGR